VTMGAGYLNCSKPLLLGRDRIPEDLIQGVMSQEGMISKEEVLKTMIELCLDLGHRDSASWIRAADSVW